jgi:hypothetical protein
MLFVGVGRFSGNLAVGSMGDRLVAWNGAAISGEAADER